MASESQTVPDSPEQSWTILKFSELVDERYSPRAIDVSAVPETIRSRDRLTEIMETLVLDDILDQVSWDYPDNDKLRETTEELVRASVRNTIADIEQFKSHIRWSKCIPKYYTPPVPERTSLYILRMADLLVDIDTESDEINKVLNKTIYPGYEEFHFEVFHEHI